MIEVVVVFTVLVGLVYMAYRMLRVATQEHYGGFSSQKEIRSRTGDATDVASKRGHGHT